MMRKDNTVVISFDCFTQEQVKEINKEIKKNIFQKEPADASARGTTKTGEFFNLQCMPIMELICPWLYQCQNINHQIFGYDISWNFHIDTLNYNVYGTNGEYDWHVDSNHKYEFDEKLTCILNLSEEPYEGGEFHTHAEEHNFTSGTAELFNSLISHKVTPVTKGERITLTYWATGPSWR